MNATEFMPIDCAVITVSDTRTEATDASGAFLVDALNSLGHDVAVRKIIPDDQQSIVQTVQSAMDSPNIAVVILTGGTGITKRDVTPDAVKSLGTKHIPGFGELFRMLSYSDIGSSTIQSRADAWLCGETIVFVLPGSTGAVRLAWTGILKEQLDVRTRPCNFIRLLDRIQSK